MWLDLRGWVSVARFVLLGLCGYVCVAIVN